MSRGSDLTEPGEPLGLNGSDTEYNTTCLWQRLTDRTTGHDGRHGQSHVQDGNQTNPGVKPIIGPLIQNRKHNTHFLFDQKWAWTLKYRMMNQSRLVQLVTFLISFNLFWMPLFFLARHPINVISSQLTVNWSNICAESSCSSQESPACGSLGEIRTRLPLPSCKVPGNDQTWGCSHRMRTQLSQKLITVGCDGIMGKIDMRHNCIPLRLQVRCVCTCLAPTGTQRCVSHWILANFSLGLCETKYRIVVLTQRSHLFPFLSNDRPTEERSSDVRLLQEAKKTKS